MAGSKTTKTKSRSKKPGMLVSMARRISGQNKPLWLKTVRWLVFLAVLGILLGAIAFFLLYWLIKIPDANADFQTQTTKVYYSDGKHQIGTFAMQDRENISLDEVPDSMQAAAIAAEDRSFYSNRGIDFKGILRAVRDNASSGSIQGGGSTITQQYVKILYLTQERTITRKVKEAILSIKIHNQLSKRDILEGYLNTIYFGNGAYGVQVAAQTYFDKPAKKLTVPQSAVLATVVNNPSYFDPFVEGGKDRMMARYRYVLDGMAQSGAISEADAAKYSKKLPKFHQRKTNNRYGGTKGFLLSAVQKEMSNLEFSDSQVLGGGLRIVTTFDYEKQNAAVEAVQSIGPQDLKDLHTALVSVEPGNGAVRAMYGGRDYVKSQLNWATLGTQPGSAFKPFAVVAALQDGYSLQTKLNGSSPMKIGNSTIENQGDSGGQSFGNVSLEYATEKSINTAFVDITDQMTNGPQKVLDAAVDAGIPKSTADRIQPVVSVPLGFAPVAPVDMANAYATLAAEGKRANWYVVQKVSDSNKRVLHEHKTRAKQAIPEDVVADTTAAMQKVVSAGTGTNARTFCPTAGKTGTATAGPDHDQHVSSSWFVGYTPRLATAVMFNRGKGNETLDGYLNPFFGGTYPAMIFRTYMNQALAGSDCGSFPRPANLKSSKGTVYVAPPPKCGSNEELNSSKTKCVRKPRPVCGSDERLNPAKTKCVKRPNRPTPPPTQTPPSPSPTPTQTIPSPPDDPSLPPDFDEPDESNVPPPNP